MRKLATIDTITKLVPVPNSDFLELATVRHWQAVVKKGEFKVGDTIIYCEIDSLLPVKPEYEFLRKSCYKQYGETEGFRIKTMKLRGCLSQGLILPYLFSATLPIGTDVTEQLGIKLYNPPTKLHLSTDILAPFPSNLKKTEEERIQNLESLPKIPKNSKDWVVTEKLHGSSLTMYCRISGGLLQHFGVCSRNYELKISTSSAFWAKAIELDIERKLMDLAISGYGEGYEETIIVLQGEIVGNKLNGNHYGLKGTNFYAFSVYVSLDYPEPIRLGLENKLALLDRLGLRHVPILDISTNLFSHNDYLEYASGSSALNPTTSREGIVVRDREEETSFKVISNEFLLKEKD